jgi:hypothetical protein
MKNLSKNTIPHTCLFATVTQIKKAHDVFAIEVKNAKYRGATFSGIIELVNGSDSIRKFKGAYRANAKLAWFGQELKMRNPFINLSGAEVMLLPSYSGEVVACLG